MKQPTKCFATNPLSLNLNHVLLLPFTLKPFGALGYFARKFLFLPSFTIILLPLKPPWTNNHLSLSNNVVIPCPAAFTSFQLATSSSIPSHLFSCIDAATWNTSHPNDPFETSYHTQLPSQWATQMLSINFFTCIAQHLSPLFFSCRF
jgi:hypothetical protein